jgi:putative spermidine/putrescine transport system permease protein
VVLSVMMASPTLQTLPVKMWTTLRQDLTPGDRRRLDAADRPVGIGHGDRRRLRRRNEISA